MSTIKVILCDDVDSVGHIGETVKVAPGYARNFLIPRKLAVLAESASARDGRGKLPTTCPDHATLNDRVAQSKTL